MVRCSAAKGLQELPHAAHDACIMFRSMASIAAWMAISAMLLLPATGTASNNTSKYVGHLCSHAENGSWLLLARTFGLAHGMCSTGAWGVRVKNFEKVPKSFSEGLFNLGPLVSVVMVPRSPLQGKVLLRGVCKGGPISCSRSFLR